MTLDDEVARLGQTRPFDLLPREAVQLIAFSCEKRRLRAGEALFFAGETANSGYFVHSGAITLLEDGAEPKAERRVSAGALIGESALYAPTARHVSARAAEDAVVMRIPRETFRRVLTEFPAGAAENSRRPRRPDAPPGRRTGSNPHQIVRRLPRAETPGCAVTAEAPSGLSSLRAPSSEDIDALARAAFERLPASFRRLSDGLIIQVVDFPDDGTLNEMGAESEFDLLGLFRGRGLAQRGATEETGELPNMIWLYRRPLLDFWCDGEDSLEEVVTHVLVHEIGHHFGLSDADIEAIEQSAR